MLKHKRDIEYRDNHPVYVWRKQKSLTQNDVAKLLGVTDAMIGSLETGRRVTRPEFLEKFKQVVKNYED